MGYPSLEETRAHFNELDEEERASLERSEKYWAEFEGRKLKPTTELPNLTEPSFTLVWDDSNAGPDKHETVIKLGDRVIFSELGGWENYERFIEVAKILRARYGSAMKDLVPTYRSMGSLGGDYWHAFSNMDAARENIFGIKVTDANRWADREPLTEGTHAKTEQSPLPEGMTGGRANPQSYPLSEHPWWEVALDHLEQQWPQKLEKLLREGKLKDYLDRLVSACLLQSDAEREAGADDVEAANAVDRWLEPENPKFDPDNPKQLSPRGQELLSRFKSLYL